MSSLKKDIQDILGCTCAFNEQYDEKSYNLKTEEYEPCSCVKQIPAILNLIESVIGEDEPYPRPANQKDYDFDNNRHRYTQGYWVGYRKAKRDIKSRLIGKE